MMKVLLIDDEKKIRDMYGKTIKNEGYEVFEASDAIEACYVLQSICIDIILLDIEMPCIKGTEFYNVIRTDHKNSKVIVASVYPIDKQMKLIQGAADYYDKSDGIEVLLKKIKEIERNINNIEHR